MACDKQNEILDIIELLDGHNATTVTHEIDLSKIYVRNRMAFVPDYEFIWAGDEACYYKCYIKLINSTRDKSEIAGYTFMRVQNIFSALDFVDIVRRVYRNRSNISKN